MFTTIGSLLSNPPNASQVIEDGTLEEFKYSTYEQNPVDVEKFLYGENHLALSIRLSQPQLDLVDGYNKQIIKPFKVAEGDLLTFPSNIIHRSPINNGPMKTIISFNSDYEYINKNCQE